MFYKIMRTSHDTEFHIDLSTLSTRYEYNSMSQCDIEANYVYKSKYKPLEIRGKGDVQQYKIIKINKLKQNFKQNIGMLKN